MTHVPQAQVLITLRDDGGFAVLDALEREHFVSNPTELGDLLARLVRDPELPVPVLLSQTQVLLEKGFTKVARRVVGGELDEFAVAAGRVGAAVGTRAATAVVDAAKDWWSERKKPQPAVKRNGAAKSTAKKRPSSLRFSEEG